METFVEGEKAYGANEYSFVYGKIVSVDLFCVIIKTNSVDNCAFLPENVFRHVDNAVTRFEFLRKQMQK